MSSNDPRPQLHLNLLELDAGSRVEAAAGLDLSLPGAFFAARERLLRDEDATVRAAAAERLAAYTVPHNERVPFATALTDALYDTHPSVRMAAARTLAKRRREVAGAGVALDVARELLGRLAVEDPIWWVRRAALFALGAVGGRGQHRQSVVGTLKAALDDPFWRVRHAAVRALALLSSDDRDLLIAREEDLPDTDRARAAFAYLERRQKRDRGEGVTARITHFNATDVPTGKVFDSDPAVIAARLERGDTTPTAAELALYLGDPHESLRRAAAARLRARRDTRALLLASLWLEEPRIPHATATVVALLDQLGPDETDALLDVALSPVERDSRPGLAAWALSFLDGTRRRDVDLFLDAVMSKVALVRRVAISALGRASFSAEVRARLLHVVATEPDEDARRLAIHALVRRDPLDDTLLTVVDFDREPPLIRRLLATIIRDEDTLLRVARDDEDAATRATALSLLMHFNALPTDVAATARRDPDPWVRRAVLDIEHTLQVLEVDVDPLLRRAAFELAARRGLGAVAARVVAHDADPWLRTQAARVLARAALPAHNGGDRSDLVTLLELTRDAELSVRAAAADVVGAPGLVDALATLHGDVTLPIEVREAADTWLGIRAPEIISAHVGGRTNESAPATSKTTPRPSARLRPLGRSEVEVPSLVISGANEPSVSSLFRAWEHGASAFFWEPRYRNLSAFLRAAAERGEHPSVVAGTYHATQEAITQDVERALKRLKRQALDVFLVFWVRSANRLDAEVTETLQALKREGLVRAIGFSTHDRALATAVVSGPSPFDVLMVRHSAAHPGAEDQLFAAAREREVGVLSFSATSYGRLLEASPNGPRPPSAAECYRYSLAQSGVTACVSAPRGGRELIENLEVIAEPSLAGGDTRLAELRAHGRRIREESLDFGGHIRRFAALPDSFEDQLAAEIRPDLAPSP